MSKNNKFQITTVLNFIIVFLLLSTFAAAAGIGDWSGRVFVDGSQVNDTSVVEAFRDGATDFTSPLAFDTIGTPDSGYYLIHVSTNDGDLIYFRVDGLNASNLVTFATGDHGEFNLSSNKTSDGANGASCTYSRGCSGGYCCSGATEYTDGSGTGTCQSSVCPAPTPTPPGGGGGGTSGGGGAAAPVVTTTNLEEKADFESASGFTRESAQGSEFSFLDSKGNKHTIKITKVYVDRILVTINSPGPITITVKIGETKEVDINNDGVKDISIKLVSIVYGKAKLTFRKLAKPGAFNIINIIKDYYAGVSTYTAFNIINSIKNFYTGG